MKSAGSWALVAAMVTLTTACTFMFYRIFRLRHSFDIAARSPALFCLTGLSNLVVTNIILLHQVLRFEGQGLPCYATFWPSYSWFAFSCTPYCLRACRLVVVYNTNYRQKFARFVKSKALLNSWALSATAIFAYAAAIFAHMQDRYARGNYGCFFFHEKLVLEIGLGCCIPPASFLMFKLIAVDDALGIRPEIFSVLVGSIAAGALQIALLELVATDILPASPAVHTVSNMFVLAANLNGLYWGTVVPLSYHRRFGKRRVVPSPASRRGYHSDHHSTHTSVEGEPTCLRYARKGGDLATLFGDFCKRCLCAESWEFIVEVVAYEEMSQLHEQHSAFIGIVDKYLRSMSPQEINISSAMKASILQYQNIEQFSELDEARRWGILGLPALEISRMLEQNLLNRFRETPEMQLRLKQERREEVEMKQAEEALGLLRSFSLGSPAGCNASMSEPPQHGVLEGHDTLE